MTATPEDPAKAGFIIMPFLPELAWLHRAIVEAGRRAGVRLKRADDIFEPGVVLDQIRDAIDASDVIVAVCTGRNANVFFEMGMAWREHKPVMVAETVDDLPFDVSHYRTAIYGGTEHGQDTASLGDRLEKHIAAVLAEERLPRGRRLAAAPEQRKVARLSGRYDSSHNGNGRFTITNNGTVEMRNVDVEVPAEARSFRLHGDELPLKVLRPGTSVALPAITFMGGGAQIFDVILRGETADGEPYEHPETVSLY